MTCQVVALAQEPTVAMEAIELNAGAASKKDRDRIEDTLSSEHSDADLRTTPR